MRKRIAVAIVPAITAAVLAAPATAATKTIKIGDNFFAPETVKVKKGTTVTWDWVGQVIHNVTVTAGPQKFHSATQTEGTFKRRLTKAGTYKIVCTIHPGMDMTLKVR